MKFEKMKLYNNTVQETNESLKKQLFASHSKIQQLEIENSSLKQQNQTQLDQINELNQRIKQLLQQNNNNHNVNDENKNTLNQINWNFNINNNENNTNSNNTNQATSNILTTTTNTNTNTNTITITKNKNSRKRPRSDSENAEYIADPTETIKKPKLSKSGSTSISLSQSGSIDILEKRLPTNLDLIRGDILAEAGCDDQISYCFNMLKKCSTDEWQLRNFLMQMICGLCEENKYMDHSIVWESRHIIKKQLTDLRSAIVKTACEMLMIFSKYCDKIKFGQCLSFFIPTHLQGLYVTIACIRDAHDQCLSECINNTQSFKCINPLLKGLQNKHSEVRVKVINLLSSLITAYSTSSSTNNGNNNMDKKLGKYADAIGNTIKTYLGDSKPSVRDAVKKLFENYAAAFPVRAKSLLSRMDSNHQKTLRKCIGNNKPKTKRHASSSGYGQTRTRRK